MEDVSLLNSNHAIVSQVSSELIGERVYSGDVR
jgi:hypothetical protein